MVSDVGTYPFDVIPFGFPFINRQGDKLGFYLNKGSGYSIDGNILPVVDDLLMPFSVTFSYYLKESQLNSCFLNISGDGKEFFSISTEYAGTLVAELFQTGGNIGNSSGIAPENYNEITLSVVPDNGELSFYWYGDGLLLSSDVYSYKEGVPEGDYNTVLGGDSGFEGLLDEFGVYYQDEQGRNNIDDNIFKRRVNRKYNYGKVIEVYGFDGLYSDYAFDPRLAVSSGNLDLIYKSEFQFLETDLNFTNLYIDIDFEQITHGTEIRIHLSEDSGEKIVHINLEELSWILDDSQNLEIDISIKNSILSVSYFGKIIAETKVEIDSAAVFYVVNNSESKTTKISSLLVRREEKRVVAKKVDDLEIKL